MSRGFKKMFGLGTRDPPPIEPYQGFRGPQDDTASVQIIFDSPPHFNHDVVEWESKEQVLYQKAPPSTYSPSRTGSVRSFGSSIRSSLRPRPKSHNVPPMPVLDELPPLGTAPEPHFGLPQAHHQPYQAGGGGYHGGDGGHGPGSSASSASFTSPSTSATTSGASTSTNTSTSTGTGPGPHVEITALDIRGSTRLLRLLFGLEQDIFDMRFLQPEDTEDLRLRAQKVRQADAIVAEIQNSIATWKATTGANWDENEQAQLDYIVKIVDSLSNLRGYERH